MPNEHETSLRVLRWMIIAAVAVPCILLGLLSWTAYRSSWSSADQDIARALDVTHEHALKVFETIDLSLSDIAESTRGMTDAALATDASLRARLTHVSDLLPQLKSLWVFDASGQALVNSLDATPSGTSFADRDYFRAHTGGDVGLYVGETLEPRPPYAGQPFFSVSRRRQTPEGAFNGVIQASVLPSYFEQFYARLAREPGAFFALGLPDGRIIARYPAIGLSARIDPKGAVGTTMAAHPQAGLMTVISPADGVARRVAYQRLADYPIYVAAGLDTAAIRQRWVSTILPYLGFGLPATAVVVLLLWLAFRRTQKAFEEVTKRQIAEDALIRAQRLEALGQLTGGVAHDFNNFLTVIGSSADLLNRPEISLERRQRYAQAIADTVKRAARLTAQLLAFSRRQALKPEVFELGKCLTSVTAIIKALAGTHIKVAMQLPNDPLVVEADLSQFETALINLAVNARDAMNGKGTIVIRAFVADSLPDSLKAAGAPGFAAIAVADTGSGIPADHIDRIFDPFFTTKPVGQGTGLGLSQVFGFIKQSGGDISVETRIGAGTTFTIYLPLSTRDAIAKRTAAFEPTALRHLRVLVVDDNPDIAAFTALSLRELGHETLTASTGADALDELRRNADRLDVVFTDVRMPGMDGFELLHEIRERYATLPVVLTSGYSEYHVSEIDPELHFIQKPYTVDQLVNVLARAAAATMVA
jgi:signal transduction histidine kinase